MRELDDLELYIQRAGPRLPDKDRKQIAEALEFTRDAFTLLETKYLDAIRDKAIIHSLLKKTSEDLIHRYRAIFEYSGTAMVVLERDGTISLANSYFVNLVGYSRLEIEGNKKFSEFADTVLNDLVGQYLLQVGRR